jgi:hypothetical protein
MIAQTVLNKMKKKKDIIINKYDIYLPYQYIKNTYDRHRLKFIHLKAERKKSFIVSTIIFIGQLNSIIYIQA